MTYSDKALIKEKVNSLLSKMTLNEKIGQLYQAPYFSDIVTGHSFDSSQTIKRIKGGMVGSILSVHDEDVIRKLQKTAVEESRLGIPLLFAFDVIHGYKTSFPINLALSNTWDETLVKKIAKAIAYETSHRGLHLTFSPMLDLVRDPRWGRVMESNGEDPYLSSILGKAYIEGYQQNDLSNSDSVAACAKHFIGYGHVEAGREYNTVDISKRVLYNMYLPQFKTAINANVSMIMTSFNTVFDVPATANKTLLKDILRDELKFKGVTISDYTSTEEIINHKIADDLKDVAKQCFNAGLDHEMVSESYIQHLNELVQEKTVSENDINESVKRMLSLKYELGLFDKPYAYLYENSNQYLLNESTVKLAREAAEKSIVMLKNDQILPISKDKKIVLCGPYVDSKDVIGEWAALCKKDDVTSIKEAFINNNYSNMNDETKDNVKNADIILMALGEPGSHAGEGNSKANIYLDKTQKEYFDSIRKINPNIVLIVFAGRPLIISHYHQYAKAILYAYQPGMETGNAIYNLVTGKVSPSAKLTMTLPYHEGQIPIYYNHYNTGRPYDEKRPKYRYNTRYIDCPNEPLYPFGYGLSYGNIKYLDFEIDKQIFKKYDKLSIKVTVENDNQYAVDEIVQCYIEAITYSVSRPVNELKSFKRVTFKPFEKKIIEFELSIEDFRAFNLNMEWTAEHRKYKVKVGPNSRDLISKKIEVVDEVS
jgi:beta-glucosidase